jgi:TolA-binding protein
LLLVTPAAAEEATPPEVQVEVREIATAEWSHYHLRRAVSAWRRGEASRAVAHLERATEVRYPESGRARFLLALAYLEIGHAQRFEVLVGTPWPVDDAFGAWENALAEAASTLGWLEREPGPVNDDDGRALGAYLATRGVFADPEVFETLASLSSNSPLAAELADLAALELAERAIASGEDAERWLARVDDDGRWVATRDRLRVLVRGEEPRDHEIDGRTDTRGRDRAHSLALGGRALEVGDWEIAQRHYRDADASWRAAMAKVAESGVVDSDALWRRWSTGWGMNAITLNAERTRNDVMQAAGDALTLAEKRPALAPVTHGSVHPGIAPAVPPPDPQVLAEVARSAADLADLRAETHAREFQRIAELSELTARRRYLGHGAKSLEEEWLSLDTQVANVDSLRARAGRSLHALDQVTEAAIERVREKAATMRRRAAEHERWMNGLQTVYVDGPAARRDPDAMARVRAAIELESSLAVRLDALADRWASEGTDLIARSHRDRWRPGLVAEVDAIGRRTNDLFARANDLWIQVQRAADFARSSERVEELTASIDALREETIRLEAAHLALRMSVALDAVGAERARLIAQREEIDYGIAAAGHRAALASTGSESRDQTVANIDVFLQRYPESRARGDMRFRLAELRLIDTQETFERKLAEFLRGADGDRERAARAVMPFIDLAPVLDLYVSILEEDPAFPHRDAVLFNAGMLLVDEGDPRGGRYLAELTRDFGESEHAQHAWLKLGDLAFDDRRYDDALPAYGHAADGENPSLTAAALYKRGWCELGLDRYPNAIESFCRLLDVYDTDGVKLEADLRGEAKEHLVEAFARSGGAETLAATFARIGDRPYERELLRELGRAQREYSFFGEAIASQNLWLTRYPNESEALDVARDMLATYADSKRVPEANAARLTLAARFTPDQPWSKNQPDSLRRAGSSFARESYLAVASYHHRRARERVARGDVAEVDWRMALELYRKVIGHWPRQADVPALHLSAGEAALNLAAYGPAMRHYRAASQSPDTSLARTGSWQMLAAADAWYTAAADPQGAAPDSLARSVIGAAVIHSERFPADTRTCDARWRAGNLAFTHGWYGEAGAIFDRVVDACSGDARVPMASVLRADAAFRLEEFDDAGRAYEAARRVARDTGVDSLVARCETAIPASYFKHAQQLEITDASAEETAAAFRLVADRWPSVEYADVARYQSALAWARADDPGTAVAEWNRLVDEMPESDLRRDAMVQVAETWEGAREPRLASDAYKRLSSAFPDDDSAPSAWLRAADLLDTAGDASGAENVRIEYLARYPDDLDTAVEILEPLAKRELDRVSSTYTMAHALAVAADGSAPYLARYLNLATSDPNLVDLALIGRVRYYEGEDARIVYEKQALTQPLAQSIEIKKTGLESTIAAYQRAAEVGASRWAHASAFRIGQALVNFGLSLESSERPVEIVGDDLYAYEDVLFEQSDTFHVRGETVWFDLLSQKGWSEDPGGWLVRSRDALWSRLSLRFLSRAEVAHPLIDASPPSVYSPMELAEEGEVGRLDGADAPDSDSASQ